MSLHNLDKRVRRAVLVGHLKRAFNELDELAQVVSQWRDQSRPLTCDKADYRAIGRQLDEAVEAIEKALERLSK